MSFENIFNHKHQVKESANARVNLIGEHTDYTGGYVMPTLLSFKNTIELSRNEEKRFVVFSLNISIVNELSSLHPYPPQNGLYAFGVDSAKA